MPENERLDLPFTGIASFAKYPVCASLDDLESDVAIIGVPYDMGSQWRAGQRFGPRAIREASTLYGFGRDGAYDPEREITFLGPEWRIFDVGDVDIVHGELHRSFDNVRRNVEKVLERGAMPVVLGGDHSVTIPVLQALESEGYFAVVQIDAHLDFVDERAGQRLGNGSPMRRAAEMDHVSGLYQVGIHGLSSSKEEDFRAARAYGSRIVGAREFKDRGAARVLDDIPSAERYYVTIDVDALDPALCPGSGSPSPGGLSYEELVDFLEGIPSKGQVIGFDVVEVSPPHDPSGLTSQVAARLVLDLLGFVLLASPKRRTS
jgi:agmatinase